MKKIWNIVLGVLCVNWVIIGVYSINHLDEDLVQRVVGELKQATSFLQEERSNVQTNDGVSGDEQVLLQDDGAEMNELVSELVEGDGVVDATEDATEPILDELGEVCVMIDVDCSFKIMTLQERYGDKLSETVQLDPSVITYDDLRYLQIPHIGYDGEVHLGEMIVNVAIAEEVVEIFKDLFLLKYPIEKMLTIDHYGGSDADSMADNNSSGFNYRLSTSGKKVSQHGYGLAIDLNPIMNPYIMNDVVLPASGMSYVNRNQDAIGMIKKGDPIYEAFVSRGWTWGGDWSSLKDYQHFEKAIKK